MVKIRFWPSDKNAWFISILQNASNQQKLSAGDDPLTNDDLCWPEFEFIWPSNDLNDKILNVNKFNTGSSDSIFAMPLAIGTGSTFWSTWTLRFRFKHFNWQMVGQCAYWKAWDLKCTILTVSYNHGVPPKSPTSSSLQIEKKLGTLEVGNRIYTKLVTRKKLRIFTNGLGIKFEIKTKAVKPHSNVSYLIFYL